MDFPPTFPLLFKFSTFIDSVPTSLVGGVVSCYKDSTSAETTNGITLDLDFDGRTGMHSIFIDPEADAAFYQAGHYYQLVITAGTVGGKNAAGFVIEQFTLGMTKPAPTVEEIDAHLSANHGNGSWSAFGIPGAYPINAVVTDGLNPVAGATVRIIDGITPRANITDLSGFAPFTLDAGTYEVGVTKPGYQFVPTTRTVTGAHAGTLTEPLVMTQTVLPPLPIAPGYINIYGYMRDVRTGEMLRNVSVVAKRVPKGIAYAGGILVGEQIVAASDKDGLVVLSVPRSDSIYTPGNKTDSQWRIECPEAGINFQQPFNSDYNLNSLFL